MLPTLHWLLRHMIDHALGCGKGLSETKKKGRAGEDTGAACLTANLS